MRTWLQPREVDRLHHVEGQELVGIGLDSDSGVRQLVAYQASTRQTTTTPLDQTYYGLFFGVDRRRRLYLAVGRRLAR